MYVRTAPHASPEASSCLKPVSPIQSSRAHSLSRSRAASFHPPFCSFEADLFCSRRLRHLAAARHDQLSLRPSAETLPTSRGLDSSKVRSLQPLPNHMWRQRADSFSAKDEAELTCDCFIDEWWRCGRLPSMKPVVWINSFGGSVPVRATCHILLLPPALMLLQRALRPVSRVKWCMCGEEAHMPVLVEAQWSPPAAGSQCEPATGGDA